MSDQTNEPNNAAFDPDEAVNRYLCDRACEASLAELSHIFKILAARCKDTPRALKADHASRECALMHRKFTECAALMTEFPRLERAVAVASIAELAFEMRASLVPPAIQEAHERTTVALETAALSAALTIRDFRANADRYFS